ncbi:unnamed protein product [Rotaria sp. Silwood2]|nr:unnamed protein product [Rotaria sp. Silwood2]CAF4474095.1 unnamed protein product [Rotaria sp. Silwood2]
MYDSGVKLINDYSMIYSGLPSTNKTRSAHGVAILLDQNATQVWKNSGSNWEAVSERIIKIRLKCTPINITVLSVYSPVNPTDKQMIESSEKFYNDLQDTLNKISTDDMIIIMGDLNARVGGDQQQPTLNNCIGPFTVDKVNENGTRLMDFCMMNNIIISNTFFQHKLIHQTSWMHPGSKIWHILDYTLVNKKFRSSIEDCRMYRRAAGAIGTDHHLMRVKIKLHLKCRRKKQQVKRTKLDYTKFKNAKTLEMFQEDLSKTLSDAKDKNITIDDKYSLFVECLKGNAEKHFKLDNRKNGKRKEWLTDEILKIIDQKSLAFVNWQNHRGTKSETIYRNKYKRLRKLVKTKIDARQVEYWDEICEEIEKSVKLNDPATAFSIIRRLRGGSKGVENIPIRDRNGKLLVNSEDRLERWCEFFEELLNVPQAVNPDLINEIPILPLSKEEENRQNAEPSVEEIRKALCQMKSRKAPGHDEITVDILKAGGLPVLKWLYEIFVDVWKNEEMMDNWNLAILIRLFKKGDKQLCDNYRGISLLSVISKLFSRIILNRIQQLIDNQLLESQSGFRANRSTIDQIFILKMIMEKRKEFNKPLFLCFIDITKAYDSVNRKLLWKVCRKYGISGKLVNLLKMLYKDSKAKVRIEGELSSSFLIKTGVLQDGIPSPILFNMLFDFIIRKVIDEAGVSGVQFSYGSNDFYHGQRENYEKFNILNLLYADDLVVMCETANDLETFIKTFEKITQDYGLTMSVKKTCIMALQQFEEDYNRIILKNIEVNHHITGINIRNQTIEIVDSFVYLGCNVTRDQRSDKELDTRLRKAATAFNMLRHVIWYRKTVSITSRLRIFRACILPVLLYGSETWSITTLHERRINSFYMKCIRTIVGVNLGDRISNETLLKITGQPPIENIIRRNRLRWFGHVNRMLNNNKEPSIVKKIMFSYFPTEKRPRNMGIRKRWEDKVQNDIEICQIKNWRRDTLDRDFWRQVINKHVIIRPIDSNIKEIIFGYKQGAVKRRNEQLAATYGVGKRKVSEVLTKGANNKYKCPGCRELYKPQGITNHVKACPKAKEWCKTNNIK